MRTIILFLIVLLTRSYAEDVLNGRRYVIALHREKTRSDLIDLAAEVQKYHLDETKQEYSANVQEVMHNMRMMIIEDPSHEALMHLKGHAHIEHFEEDVAMTIDELPTSAEIIQQTLERTLEHAPASIKHRSSLRGAEKLVKTAGGSYCSTHSYNWGLDAIDDGGINTDCQEYTPPDPTDGGRGVNVYVLDTGLQTNHIEFAGERSVKNRWFNQFQAGGTWGDNDINGHGTHVAALIAGVTVGVAPNANILGVKVMNDQGGGVSSDMIRALEYIADEKTKTPQQKMLVNIAVSGSKSFSLNTAVNELSKLGVPVVVSAGNEGINACQRSPSSAWAAITVAASDQGGALWQHSNHGSCVDIVAPGVQITSACSADSLGCTAEKNSIYSRASGTSQAAPFVAGVMALSMKAFEEFTASPTPWTGRKYVRCPAVMEELINLSARTDNAFINVPNFPLTYAEELCIGLVTEEEPINF